MSFSKRVAVMLSDVIEEVSKKLEPHTREGVTGRCIVLRTLDGSGSTIHCFRGTYSGQPIIDIEIIMKDGIMRGGPVMTVYKDKQKRKYEYKQKLKRIDGRKIIREISGEWRLKT